MAKPSRYDRSYVQAKRDKIKEARDNPGDERSVPAVVARVERIEQALGLRPLP